MDYERDLPYTNHSLRRLDKRTGAPRSHELLPSSIKMKQFRHHKNKLAHVWYVALTIWSLYGPELINRGKLCTNISHANDPKFTLMHVKNALLETWDMSVLNTMNCAREHAYRKTSLLVYCLEFMGCLSCYT